MGIDKDLVCARGKLEGIYTMRLLLDNHWLHAAVDFMLVSDSGLIVCEADSDAFCLGSDNAALPVCMTQSRIVVGATWCSCRRAASSSVPTWSSCHFFSWKELAKLLGSAWSSSGASRSSRLHRAGRGGGYDLCGARR